MVGSRTRRRVAAADSQAGQEGLKLRFCLKRGRVFMASNASCMRLGTGQSGATFATCILWDGSPPTRAHKWARFLATRMYCHIPMPI